MMMQFHETIFMHYTRKTFYFNNTASTPECKETCNATIGLDGQGPDPKTKSSETSSASCSQYQPNTVRALDHQTTALSKTGQIIRLQTPGAPTRPALGPTSVSSPS
ncbi:hypothetical protein M9H77_34942 [Catharanthus roseus]|uniref:Uncharacterized protein n=1 Tax=Catharanthus roseus TaxID=4058 RepID=A0ACB9ZML3_CATRO|nr:hypothetical protein M9H77_34942 [Catharanthus roseus]